MNLDSGIQNIIISQGIDIFYPEVAEAMDDMINAADDTFDTFKKAI